MSGHPKDALKSAIDALEREFGQRDSLVRSAKQALKDLLKVMAVIILFENFHVLWRI